jgi:hypothetical protein
MLEQGHAQPVRPLPRPVLIEIIAPAGEPIFDCEDEDWFDQTPERKQYVGPDRITLTADRTTLSDDTERIWHVVTNGRDLSISFEWRALSGTTIVAVEHGDGLAEHRSACTMHEHEPGDFDGAVPSEFLLNTGGFEEVAAYHFALAPQEESTEAGSPEEQADASRAKPSRFLMFLEPSSDGETGMAAQIVIEPDPASGEFLIDFQHYPEGSTLLVSSDAFDGEIQFQTGGRDTEVEFVKIADVLPELGEARLLGSLEGMGFHMLDWREEGYTLSGVALANRNAPAILVSPDGGVALISGFAFMRTGGEVSGS